MAAFSYRAVTKAGKPENGVMEAGSAALARQSLRGRGLLPIEVAPTRDSTPASGASSRQLALRSEMPQRSLILVTRQMATLLGSGVRIEDALATIAQQQPARAAGVLLNVRAAVLEGQSFGSALGGYPKIFSDYYRASVLAGEQSGRLDQVMEHLAASVETRGRNRQTVQLALLYPALLAFISLAIITFLMAFVVPDIVRVFTRRGGDLPLVTRGLIAASDLVRGYGLHALAACVIAGFGFNRWLSVPANRIRFHALLARSSLTGGLVRRINAAQFAGTLATLVQSRVPLLEALVAAADVTPNRHIRARIVELTEKVRQGSSLRSAVAEADCFPPMLVAMVASGESAGHLGDALERAARDQQSDLDALVKTLVGLVEPAILLVMGGLVMLMVLAILLPIISLNNLVGI